MAKTGTVGCFYIEGKLKTVSISKETEELAYKKAFEKGVVVAQIYKDAYWWARNVKLRGELTEDLLGEFLTITTAVKIEQKEEKRGIYLL